MNKPISLLMSEHISAVDINDTIERVEKIMDRDKSSCVVVTDSTQKFFGMISYPEIVSFYKCGRNPKVERAWELCVYQVVEVRPNTTIREAAVLMLENKMHHVVVTENKSIKGIVTAADFIGEYLKHIS